jgi:23S rRNA pseudouridine1911/1915/1917 synthase
MELTYRVTAADDGQRAVDVLVRRTGMSRLLSKKVRLYGALLCNGLPQRMIDPVRAGDLLLARYSPAGPAAPLSQAPGVVVRYLDEWLLVVAKPAGMVTHPSYLHDADALTSQMSDQPLHPVNRLDRDTSGLVIIARNGHAHHVISQGALQKSYLAVLHGRLPGPAGLIHAPVRRAAGSIMLRETGSGGAPARTIWRVLRYYPAADLSLVRFRLLTGRTHQLRLHSLALGCPIVGDSLYCGGRLPDPWDKLIGRQALHALSIRFCHPLTGQMLHLTAPLPPDLLLLLRSLNRSASEPVRQF